MVFINERIKSQQNSPAVTPPLSRFVFEPEALAEHLRKTIRGQNQVIDHIESQLKVVHTGLSDPRRPLLTALSIGATGVGKTEMVRQIAQAIHGRSDAFCRIDMNTLSQSHYSAAITGAPPGYVGSKENLSLLNEDLIKGTASRPGIVLFDEIEKADHSVVLTLMNILDNGTLKLASGQKTIQFTNTLVFMTSNLGSRTAEALPWLDAIPGMSRRSIYRRALERHFKPEFLNRIGIVEYFSALRFNDLPNLVENLEHLLNQQLKRHNISLELEPNARDLIVQFSDYKKYGARAIERTFRDLVVTDLATLISRTKDLSAGTHYHGIVQDRHLEFLPVSVPRNRSNLTPKSPKATEGANYD
ncbi:AAA family ATPase [Thalassolituus sp.]|uniref:AAA family ATPase n=1 Tax=Thalassolituus sp. TaxID=2030822 RepID=UPI00351741A7